MHVTVSPHSGRRGYSRDMRRPEVELPDEAAAFVEQHPDVITRLAAGTGPVVAYSAEELEQRRAKFRDYIRAQRSAAQTPEAEAGRVAFLARYSAA